jgi:hypothetical protein
LQKVYTENVLNHQHQVWDVHTNVDRWWVITNPTNLYSQQQFPNMDLAVTFHVGLCLRIPRSEKQKLSELPIEPLAERYRYMSEASDALAHAQEVADYQAIGVRCREALLAFTKAAQTVMPWTDDKATKPKRADFKAGSITFARSPWPGQLMKNVATCSKRFSAARGDFLTGSLTPRHRDGLMRRRPHPRRNTQSA